MPLTNQETFDYLRKKVKNKQPFTLLRFGDGEGLFAFTPHGLHLKYQNACLKHWGEVPRGMYRLQITKNIRQSYRLCDLAGLPFDFAGYMWRLALNRFLQLERKKMACKANIHIALTDDGILDELITGNSLFYIGCRNVDDVLLEKGATSVHKILISEQHRFAKKKPRLPFYKQVKLIEEEVKKLDLRGVLCLLGAGVAGKQLGTLMKQQGGMVIDVGSVFDLWAGLHTRGWIPKNTETKKVVEL